MLVAKQLIPCPQQEIQTLRRLTMDRGQPKPQTEAAAQDLNKQTICGHQIVYAIPSLGSVAWY